MSAERCPSCGYVRPAEDTARMWQCPRCRLAYIKYEPGLAGPATRLAWGARSFFLGLELDPSAYALIVTNLLAIGVGFATGMRLADMLLVYWIQSVIIGLCAAIRIVALREFSIKDYSATWGVDETAAEKWRSAAFFVLHYGAMHAMYIAALVFWYDIDSTRDAYLGYAICALAFAVNHGYSLWKNIRIDAQGMPKLGDLVALPYARIIPMHLVLIIGNAAGGNVVATLLFLFFKTVVDVIMHCIEHRAFSEARPAGVYIA